MADVRKLIEYLNLSKIDYFINSSDSDFSDNSQNLSKSWKIFGNGDFNREETKKSPKFSRLIISISILLHLAILNSVLYSFTFKTYQNITVVFCCNVFWIIFLASTDFYSLQRNVKTDLIKFIKYYLIFCLFYFTLLAFAALPFEAFYHLGVLGLLFLSFIIYRKLFSVLKVTYNLETGRILNVVVIGKDYKFEKLKTAFQENKNYKLLGYFQNGEEKSNLRLGNLEEIYTYIKSNSVDEIYCTLSQLSDADLKKIICFADNNLKKIKLIPDYRGIYTRAMAMQNFDMIQLINFRNSPLDNCYAKIGKRCFDLVFSSIVIVLVLSWLIPLLYFVNLFESPGPVLFKQLRHGHNKKSFWCYKFRSMTVNNEANTLMCTRNDVRITKIGRVLRTTSIDELPQFINVFLGDMSVVGPRPHMEAHTFQFQEKVDKYLVRHLTKPGITGLAQVKGYRGEIIHKSDIINRTRLDIFYLEKWTALLDLKIIFSTVWNSISGEEKAY